MPSVYHHDEKENAIILNDCGSISLKEYMQKGRCSLENAHRIGKGVGDFLGKLHSWGKAKAELSHFFEGNHEAKVMSSWITYGRVLPTFEDNLKKLQDPDIRLSEEEAKKLKQICEETSDAMKQAINAVGPVIRPSIPRPSTDQCSHVDCNGGFLAWEPIAQF